MAEHALDSLTDRLFDSDLLPLSVIEDDGFDGDMIQWSADQSRLLKAGLRNKDDETVAMVCRKVSRRFGRPLAEQFFVITVNRMIDEENFCFVSEASEE